MTTKNQNRPRPDWSKIDLPPAYLEELHRFYDIETKLHIVQITGTAFLSFVRSDNLSDEEKDLLCLAWRHWAA